MLLARRQTQKIYRPLSTKERFAVEQVACKTHLNVVSHCFIEIEDFKEF